MILVFSQVGFNAKVFSPMVCRLKFFYSARFVIFQESGKRCSRVVLILGFICFTCVSSFLGFGILLGWRFALLFIDKKNEIFALHSL